MYNIVTLATPKELATEGDVQVAEQFYLSLLESNGSMRVDWRNRKIRMISVKQPPDFGDQSEREILTRGLWGLLVPHRYAETVVSRAAIPTGGNQQYIDRLSADYFVQVGRISRSIIVASVRVLKLVAPLYANYGRHHWQTSMPWATSIPITFTAAEVVQLEPLFQERKLLGIARQILDVIKAGHVQTLGPSAAKPTTDTAANNSGINLTVNSTVGIYLHISGSAGYGPGASSCLHVPPTSPERLRRVADCARAAEAAKTYQSASGVRLQS